jgi:two-component system response regulator RegX3
MGNETEASRDGASIERVGSETDPLVVLVDAERLIDDPFISSLVAGGFSVALINSGEQGLRFLLDIDPDLVMVNSKLPDMWGLSVLRRIRSRSAVPVIIVSFNGEEDEAVLAFEMGAADYLHQLVGPREVAARVRAAIGYGEQARASVPQLSDPETGPRGVLEAGPVAVDLGRREIFVRGERVHFRPMEFNLLALLVRNAGFVVSTDSIFAEMWPNGGPRDPKTLATHVRRIRAAVEDDPAHPRHLVTIKSSGLRFDP